MKQNLLLKRVAAFWNSTFHTFVKIKLQKTVIIKWVESSPSTIPNAIILLCVETFNAIMEGMGIFWKWGSLIGGVINTLRKLELIFFKGRLWRSYKVWHTCTSRKIQNIEKPLIVKHVNLKHGKKRMFELA